MSKSTNAWVEELNSENKAMRAEAVRALSYMGEAVLEPLLHLLESDDAPLAELAQIFGQIGQPALDQLMDWLQQPQAERREKAARLLARIADTRTVLALVMALDDADSTVRAAVAEALGSFSDPRVVAPLVETLSDEEPPVRASAAISLGNNYRDPRTRPALLEISHDPHPLVRAGTARALARLQEEEAVTRLQEMTHDEDEDVRQIAAASLQLQRGDPTVFQRMKGDVTEKVASLLDSILEDQVIDEQDMDDLRNSDPRVRARLLEVIGQQQGENAVKILLPGLQDINPAVRKTAIDALARLGQGAIAPLHGALKDDSMYCRAGAVEALGIIGDPNFSAIAPNLLQDESAMVRKQTVEVLAKLNDESAIAALRLALKDQDTEIRKLAAAALEEKGVSTGNPLGRIFRRFGRK